MTLTHEELIRLLESASSWGDDTSPREALYIGFTSDKGLTKNTVTYHTRAGGLLAVNVDESGKVVGIEIV